MDDIDLAWQLFKKTGQPAYYSLYKRLTEEDEHKNR